MTERQQDVIEILTADHRGVEQLLAHIEELTYSTAETREGRRKDLVDQAIIELIKHSVAEETEVYPRLAERVSEGEAARARHEHAEAEETMKRIDHLTPADTDYDAQVAALMAEIRQHVAEEESEIFPHLREVFSEQELLDLGTRVQRVKNVAPTRPHPAAPDRPPLNKVLGPVTGLLDRLRDAVSGRGAD